MRQDNGEFTKFIEELIDKNDILDVVRGYVDLTRKGGSYWGRCPFHHEKTGSFHVEERRKIFKCFGCGAGGNVIKFVQDIEHVSYMEAVKILAERVGMKVPTFGRVDEKKLAEKKKLTDRLCDMERELARFYHKRLTENAGAIQYLDGYGIDLKMITSYGLGYSEDTNAALKYLKSKGYNENEMFDAGVAEKSEEDGRKKTVDAMAGRIVFPHINAFGKVVGFAGMKRNGEVKYSRDSALWKRDREIYGTHMLKALKSEGDFSNLVITKSPFDTLLLAANGFKNAVSVMDGKISERQASALVRYVNKFTVVFDNVREGADKDYKGLEPLEKLGANVKIASLIEESSVKNAADKHTLKRLLARIESPKALLEYQLRAIKAGIDTSRESGRLEFVDKAKEYVFTIGETSKREAYIDVVGKLANIPPDAVRNRYFGAEIKSVPETKTGIETITSKRAGRYYTAVVALLGYAYKGYAVDSEAARYMSGKDLEFFEKVTVGERPDPRGYFNVKEADTIENTIIDENTVDKIAGDCIEIMRKEFFKSEKERLSKAIDGERDPEKKKELLKRLNDLRRR